MKSSKKAKTKRAILYTRVSTDEQAERGYSLNYQEERLRQYCSVHGIEIVGHFQDDASAKTFNRPAFNEFLEFLKTNKGKINLFLFVKWDRFSRNTEAAYAMIRSLTDQGIAVHCVEQPVDVSIPENKLMLAFYLAAPEVENERRGLNTKSGMRRAKQEGRWVGKAPTGYRNARDAANRPIILPSKDAPFVRRAFEQMAKGVYFMEEIRKELNKEGFKCTKNTFNKMLQNPFYKGIIHIPAWRDEPEEFVIGLHEQLIDEALFNKVQRVIKRANGNRADVPKRSHKELPLRGHLICQKCEGNLTGSQSKGNGGKYFYYHCQKGCKERFSATEANRHFLAYLNAIKPSQEIAMLYLRIMEDIFKTKEGSKKDALKRIDKEILQEEERLASATEKFIDNQISIDAYKRYESRLNEKLAALNEQRQDMEKMETSLDRYARYGTALISDLPGYFQRAELPIKQKMLGLIFPEKITYDNGEYRTKRLNQAIALIGGIKADFESNKEGPTVALNDRSSKVALPGFEP